MTVQELCKAKKDALGITSQEIADASGIPLSTVNNFFASASKAPAIYTAGPICAVLGISLDAYFNIGDKLTPTEETLNMEKEGLEHRLSGKAETIMFLEQCLRFRRRLIAAMMVIIILLVIWCVYIDMHCLDYGLWRG